MAHDELDVSGMPAIDGHCHPFPATAMSMSAGLLRDAISVSLRGPSSPLNETMVLSRVAIRELAVFLGCDPTYEAVVAVRNAVVAEDEAAFVDRLYAAQGIAGLLVDPGFPASPTIDAPGFAARVPVPVWEGYRIERFFPATGSFHGCTGAPPARPFREVLAAFSVEMDTQARRPGFAFFKSIVAYRTGLAIRPVTDVEVARAWQDHRAYGDPEEKVVRDYLFRVTCAKAREHGVPFQLHTGHTSHANPWPNVNPILLTPILNERDVEETTLVILHAGYPYCAEAGYLTSVYPNLACDLSLMIPWASGGIARRIGEVLEAAPLAKLTYGSDAIHLPEMNWLGALVGRRGLAKALATLVADRLLTVGEAEDAAADVLHRNANRIYNLNARSPVPRSSTDGRTERRLAAAAAERTCP